MTPQERNQLIEQYANGPAEVAASLEGFPAGGLAAHPIPGKWSAAEIVHHLSDSETISATRVRRLVAEPFPIIPGYDQELYARALRYNERDIAPAMANLRAVRAVTTELLWTLSEADWLKQGWHTDAGLYTTERWLGIYAVHARNHAAQIVRLREALGAAR